VKRGPIGPDGREGKPIRLGQAKLHAFLPREEETRRLSALARAIVTFATRQERSMALVHSYQMSARAGSEVALAAALEALGDAVKGIAGSQGAMVLRDRKEPQKFLFLEFWDGEDSRKAAGSQLPKDIMGQIMAAQGGPLQMADWDRLAG
jgi:hypothetical protein